MSTHNICFMENGEAILMSTHNICFMENYRKLSFNYHQIHSLPVPLITQSCPHLIPLLPHLLVQITVKFAPWPQLHYFSRDWSCNNFYGHSLPTTDSGSCQL